MSNAYTDTDTVLPVAEIYVVDAQLQKVDQIITQVLLEEPNSNNDIVLDGNVSLYQSFHEYEKEMGMTDSHIVSLDISNDAIVVSSINEGHVDIHQTALILGALIQTQPDDTYWFVDLIFTGNSTNECSTMVVCKGGYVLTQVKDLLDTSIRDLRYTWAY